MTSARRPTPEPVLYLVLFIVSSVCHAGCGDSSKGPSAANTSPFSYTTFEAPPMTYRPWVRWWWPGGDVTNEELAREVDLLVTDYFGGAEIQPFDAGLDPGAPTAELDRRRSFDTESYYRHLSYVMDEALDHGLPMDLTLGSGWPSGGMHVLPEESIKTLLWSEHVVQGPGLKMVNLHDPDQPIFYLVAALAEKLLNERLARYEGARATRIATVAARVTGGARSPNPLNLTDQVGLDPESIQVLTGIVDQDGVLTWEVPDGVWEIIAFYDAPDGEYPTLNAQPEPGYVIDHLDRESVVAHLEHLLGQRTTLDRHFGVPLRAFFNDSLEFKAERLFVSDFLEEFAKRRGYDLTPWLPAILVPGADNTIFDNVALRRKPEFTFSGEDSRIRYDYLHTVSDLFIERFIGSARDWATDRNLLFRSQAYGLNIDTLRAAGEANIPEAEQLYAGGSEMFLKMVSSGSLLYGRPLVSAESMVWMERAYMTTPLKIKASADKLFTSGINHIVFHGFPYHKNHTYGETGWYPFASPFAGSSEYSSNISEADPFWSYMPVLNRYIARCQYALRQGAPTADVLVYYPWLGFPTTLAAVSGHDEFLFNGQMGDLEPEAKLDSLLQVAVLLGISEVDPRVEWLSSVWPLLEEFEKNGYSWAWVNDESLEVAQIEDGAVMIRGRPFKAVVVVDTPVMRPGAATGLAKLADTGAAVLLSGQIPQRQPGFKDFHRGDAEVASAMGVVRAGSRVRSVARLEDAPQALAEIGIEPGIRFLPTRGAARYIKRDLGKGQQIFFFQNQVPEEATMSIAVEGGCSNAQWIDPWRETSDHPRVEDLGSLHVNLPSYGSGMLLCGLPDAGNLFASHHGTNQAEVPVKESRSIDSWTLSVEGEDVPGGEVSLALHSFPDWRDIEKLRYSSSPGIYHGEFELPALEEGETAWLNVGWVHGAAEVYLNGRHAGSLLAPPFVLDVGGIADQGKNEIEIKIIPPLRNRLIGKALQGDEHYQEFTKKGSTLLPAGVDGPVTIEIRSY